MLLDFGRTVFLLIHYVSYILPICFLLMSKYFYVVLFQI